MSISRGATTLLRSKANLMLDQLGIKSFSSSPAACRVRDLVTFDSIKPQKCEGSLLREDVGVPLGCFFGNRAELQQTQRGGISSLRQENNEAHQVTNELVGIKSTNCSHLNHVQKSHFSTTAGQAFSSQLTMMSPCGKPTSSGGPCGGKPPDKKPCGDKKPPCGGPKTNGCGSKGKKQNRSDCDPCLRRSFSTVGLLKSELATSVQKRSIAGKTDCNSCNQDKGSCPPAAKKSKKERLKEQQELIKKEYEAIHDCLTSRKCIRASENKKTAK